MRRLLYILLLIIIPIGVIGQNTYYVSNAGNDGYTSTQAQNPTTPWKTISKLNGITFQPGDSICFKRGDIWKESLLITESGSSGSPITITTYGSGAKPIITGRDTVDGWSGVGNWTAMGTENVWRIDQPRVGYLFGRRLWINNIEYKRNGSEPGAVAGTYPPLVDEPWYWHMDSSYLYVYSTQNPATAFSNMEKGTARAHSIRLGINQNFPSYVTISNIDLQFGHYSIYALGSDYITVDSCLLSGAYGINISAPVGYDSRNWIIKNCLFDSKCRLMGNWEAQYTIDAIKIGCNSFNIDIYNNYFLDYSHCGIVIECLSTDQRVAYILIHDNEITTPNIDYGRAMASDYYSGSNVKWYRNYIHDVTVQSQMNGDSLEFYYNIIDGVTSPSYRPGYGHGISQQGYGTVQTHYQKWYNNIIANCENYGIHMSWYPGRSSKHNNQYVNNIFYNNKDGAIYVMNSDSIYDNTFKNNIAYSTLSNPQFYYRGFDLDANSFNAADSEGDTIENNNGDNPLFKTGTFEPSILSTNVINKGIDVGLTTDYKKNPIEGFPEIGAYEYHPPSGILIDADGNFMIGSDGNIMTTE